MRAEAWLGLMVLLGIALAFWIGHYHGRHEVRSNLFVERFNGRSSYGPYVGKCIAGTDGVSVYCAQEAR